MRRLATSSVLLLFAISTSGCNATIYRSRTLRPVEAVIEGSDESGAVVRMPEGRFHIPAEQITEIDHHGNVLMIIGASLAAVGAPLMAWGFADRSIGPEIIAPGVTYLGLGIGFLIGGGIPYAQSKRAAYRYETGPNAIPPLLPISCAPREDPDGCPVPPPDGALYPP